MIGQILFQHDFLLISLIFSPSCSNHQPPSPSWWSSGICDPDADPAALLTAGAALKNYEGLVPSLETSEAPGVPVALQLHAGDAVFWFKKLKIGKQNMEGEGGGRDLNLVVFWEKFVASLTGWLNLFGLIERMTWREGDITCPTVSPIRIYIYGSLARGLDIRPDFKLTKFHNSPGHTEMIRRCVWGRIHSYRSVFVHVNTFYFHRGFLNICFLVGFPKRENKPLNFNGDSPASPGNYSHIP